MSVESNRGQSLGLTRIFGREGIELSLFFGYTKKQYIKNNKSDPWPAAEPGQRIEQGTSSAKTASISGRKTASVYKQPRPQAYQAASIHTTKAASSLQDSPISVGLFFVH